MSSDRFRGTVMAAAVLAAGAAAGPPARAADEEPTKPIESSTMDWKIGAEVGYRTLSVDGNQNLYRSQANLEEGTRLFNLSVSGTPKGSESRFFDTLMLNSSGLGGDPQQWINFTLRKRGLYRWDVRYNRSNYFFSVPDFVRFGQHTNDNRNRSIDSLLEVNAGTTRYYFGVARREFVGPAFLTQDEARDEFFVFAPADRTTDDVRAGVDLKLGRWALNLEESYRRLESNADFTLDPNGGPGNNPSNNATLTAFTRQAPIDGNNWISRASTHTSFGDRVDLSLSAISSSGRTDGTSLQSAAGTYFSTGAPPFTEKIASAYGSDLPSTLAQMGLTIRLTDSVYLNNTFRYHDYRIEGTSTVDSNLNVNGTVTLSSSTVDRVTDWTSLDTRSEVEWRANSNWTVRGGFDRLGRRVEFEERTDGSITDRQNGNQTAGSFFGNLAFHQGRKWSAFAEYHDGQVDNVFLRVDPAKLRIARVRGSYRPTDKWSFNLTAIYRHGENPNQSVQNDVLSRAYSASTDFSGKKLSLSAGFTTVSLDSSTDIVFCTGSPCVVTSAVSLWSFIDNHVFANATYRFNARLTGSVKGQSSDSRNTFPVKYSYYEPRVSARIARGYWVNLAYFRYEFDRLQDNSQDYRAQGGLFSLSGTF